MIDELGQAKLLEHGRRRVLGLGGPVPSARVDFAPGSTLVAYTDGLVEQARDFDHGLQLLTDTVHSANARTAREISNAVAATISINEPDDIAYAVIRRTASLLPTAKPT